MKLVKSNLNGMYRIVTDDYQPDITPVKVVVNLQPEEYVEVPCEFIVPDEEAIHYTNHRLYEYESIKIDYDVLKEEYDEVAKQIVHMLDGFTRKEILENNLANLGIREEMNKEDE